MISDRTNPSRLYRSRSDRMVAGVAGGVAQYLNLDPVLVRVGFIFLILAPGVGLLAYILAAIVIPLRPEGETEPEITGNVEPHRAREFAGYFLAGIGLLILAGNMGLFRFHQWEGFWPLVLIGLGVFLLMRNRNQ
jgi:phage shock protein C